jgi:hypothetical protein
MSDSKSGVSLVGALTMIFIVNKLTNAGEIAGWSWWWVLSPIWMAVAFSLLFAIGVGIADGVGGYNAKKRRNARLRKP